MRIEDIDEKDTVPEAELRPAMTRRERRKFFKAVAALVRKREAVLHGQTSDTVPGGTKHQRRVGSDMRGKRFALRDDVSDGDAIQFEDGTFYGYQMASDRNSLGPAALRQRGRAAWAEEARKVQEDQHKEKQS